MAYGSTLLQFAYTDSGDPTIREEVTPVSWLHETKLLANPIDAWFSLNV